MATPIVVVELQGNELQSLYSNSDIAFIIVKRDLQNGEPTVSGPFEPTLQKADLTRLFDGPLIPAELLESPPRQPYF